MAIKRTLGRSAPETLDQPKMAVERRARLDVNREKCIWIGVSRALPDVQQSPICQCTLGPEPVIWCDPGK